MEFFQLVIGLNGRRCLPSLSSVPRKQRPRKRTQHEKQIRFFTYFLSIIMISLVILAIWMMNWMKVPGH